jgi:hypothetical protein
VEAIDMGPPLDVGRAALKMLLNASWQATPNPNAFHDMKGLSEVNGSLLEKQQDRSQKATLSKHSSYATRKRPMAEKNRRLFG